tara:strand:- start:59 stop:577 length:519 start_codon:yes stop_codon:yes gene_type:complete
MIPYPHRICADGRRAGLAKRLVPSSRKSILRGAFASLDGDFEHPYADFGRCLIATARLVRASLIQILFSIRPERNLMEQMQYTSLFHCFVGLDVDGYVWVATVFGKNRDRLLTTDMSRKVMAATLARRAVAPLLSGGNLSVDGIQITAWASIKSFQRKEECGPPQDGGHHDP